MITVTQARENDRTTFCRQFTFNKNGYSNRELDGAVVSGMPVEGIELSGLPIGTIINIPENDTPVPYIKVHQGLPSELYDSSCDGTWIFRKDIYKNSVFASTNSNSLENSDLQKELDSIAISIYSDEVFGHIKSVKIPYRSGGGPGSDQYKDNGLSCNLFLLSGKEVGFSKSDHQSFPDDGSILQYFISGTSSDANIKRIKMYNGTAAVYFTRSPNAGGTSNVWCVASSGSWDSRDAYREYGVAWSMILDELSVVDPTPNPDGSYNLIY